MKKKSESSEIRINKFISQSGICSRREADNLIKKGLVNINGKKCITLGKKIKTDDKVEINGKEINPEKKTYILLNKPKDFITTKEDTHGRRTVFDLLKGVKERVFYVGRLDRNTTGLLLFTNDGEITKKLSHPSHKIKKIYSVTLNKDLDEDNLKKIISGIVIDNEKIMVDNINILNSRKEIGIEIHVGKNRIIRKIFESLGYKIKKLDRVTFGPLTKKDLPRGKWRRLSNIEIRNLKFFTAI
jgi:23S rRNA pseudouridine2605 synthase